MNFNSSLITGTDFEPQLQVAQNSKAARQMSLFASNGFFLSASQMTDDWFEEIPHENEVSNWLTQLAGRFGKPLTGVTRDSARPTELARLIAGFIYAPGYADTMLTESDINYQLSFDDAGEIPKECRAEVALLLRDGYFTIHPDLTLKPNRPFSRAKLLRLSTEIYQKKKWMPEMPSGIAKPTVDGKLVLKNGKGERQVTVRPDVFLFREFGNNMYPVREAALVGGEQVNYQLDALGAVKYLEIKPTDTPTTAESADQAARAGMRYNWAATGASRSSSMRSRTSSTSR